MRCVLVTGVQTCALPISVEVIVGGGSEPATIEQLFFELDSIRRAPMISALLMRHQPESCVVFCNTRRDVAELVGSLAHYGFSALALHGDMEQRDRDEVLEIGRAHV